MDKYTRWKWVNGHTRPRERETEERKARWTERTAKCTGWIDGQTNRMEEITERLSDICTDKERHGGTEGQMSRIDAWRQEKTNKLDA